MQDKKIVLGVTGGIAAYKACGVLRRFQKAGCEVRVVMTASAQKFVAPLTFETLSGHEVVTDMFPPRRTVKTRHVRWAEWADAILICPATANIIGKAAAGIADDFLSTLILASRRPLIFAPAMDYEMIENPIYRENRKKLESFGHHFIDSETGHLASGAVGPGRLADESVIYSAVESILHPSGALSGVRVLITAGPTREPIDPVRYLSNNSSGKMGFALAEAAASRGASVTLVTGPVSLETMPPVDRIDVSTAAEMNDAVLARFPDHDVLIMAAAVADFTPLHPSGSKLKKQGEAVGLKLRRTGDILKNVAAVNDGKIVVGFALETDDVLENGKRKLKEKRLTFICVNDATEPGAGFETDTNHVTLLFPDGETDDLGMLSKSATAEKILDRIEIIRGGA
ncbi:bifunctional phosphopantothenoylcysteine decarboxylase/phosphopantothenate--cysteine ligase CoaBC [bacterium]|nr:bifunctional phosphopantothenoylcysteine decarboxylase/phosphopantothenate--cysteine ligase CoaBC [bacterium]